MCNHWLLMRTKTRELRYLTQHKLPSTLKTTRRLIITSEDGRRCKIPGLIEVVMQSLATTQVELSGVVAAGAPIEPFPQPNVLRFPRA
jgi:hypothetical protein